MARLTPCDLLKIRQDLPLVILIQNMARLTPCSFDENMAKFTPCGFDENTARLTPCNFVFGNYIWCLFLRCIMEQFKLISNNPGRNFWPQALMSPVIEDSTKVWLMKIFSL